MSFLTGGGPHQKICQFLCRILLCDLEFCILIPDRYETSMLQETQNDNE
jgi:hypothetical protein